MWFVALIIAAVIAVVGAVAALVGSYHLAVICGVLLIPTLVAGTLRFTAKKNASRA